MFWVSFQYISCPVNGNKSYQPMCNPTKDRYKPIFFNKDFLDRSMTLNSYRHLIKKLPIRLSQGLKKGCRRIRVLEQYLIPVGQYLSKILECNNFFMTNNNTNYQMIIISIILNFNGCYGSDYTLFKFDYIYRDLFNYAVLSLFI